MTDLRSFTLAQLTELCTRLGWEPYRAKQMYSWLWQKGVTTLDAMTDLGKDKRTRLAQEFEIREPTLEKFVQDIDGTTKFTWRLSDSSVIESVFIPEPDRRTVCVSSQVGCGLGCVFCYTGTMGFSRNLSWHEITAQVLGVRRKVQEQDSTSHHAKRSGNRETGPAITNVVFMGMGEPFLNYDATIEALTQLNCDYGLKIGARKMTVSTAGIPDAIRRYARIPLQTRLAVSLNATDNETRDRLMPVNRSFPLEELMPTVQEFTRIKHKRVTFEYVLIDGVNNRKQDVRQLERLLKGIPCKVNLIPLNPFPGCEFRAPSEHEVERFRRALFPLLPAVTIRRSRGTDILAACGQLASSITLAAS
ncbi:MAG: 23S rRNA (adenine(2503)-C(2))-methyltransferase RlmN [candidate division WOR-3 bacterium]